MRDQLLAMLGGRTGHFQMESGFHSERWFELTLVLADRRRLAPFVTELACRLAAHRIDAVCGPMTGGAKLAEMIASELGCEYFFAERFESPDVTGLFPVRYALPAEQRSRVRGKAVAIVDDAISAGSAVRGTLTDLLACEAKPVALGALFIFGEAADVFAREHQLALDGLARTSFGMWKPDECPLCRAGAALEKVSDAG